MQKIKIYKNKIDDLKMIGKIFIYFGFKIVK